MAFALSVFVSGAHLATVTLIDARRAKQVQELNEIALRRSEAAVDFSAATLADLARRGPLNCEATALQAVRLQVYQRGAVKDIRVVKRDGSVVCSAYAETLEFDNGWASRADMLPSEDVAVLLFRVDQINGIALGVLRDIDASTSLVAILGINSYVFDVMPSELRAYSEVLLELTNADTLTRYAPRGDKPLADPLSFSVTSARYPLRTTIRIEAQAFERWNNEPYWPIMALAAALGLSFGLLLLRAVDGPASEVAELDAALRAGEFRPYYQPMFNLRSGAVIGCEALARRIRADGSIEPPSTFIALAERSGRIQAMTWQILACALRELQPLMQRDKAMKLSINIVPHHMLQPDFIDTLRGHVRDARVSARQIVLELTEREPLPDLAKAAEVVRRLRDEGFRVAIDDVGIGHSGLSQIQGLGASTIKIDKIFVDRIAIDPASNAIVEMLVRLSRELNMTLVAEGIENRQQVASLIACGVQEGQGYLMAPPLPIDRFIALVDAAAVSEKTAAAAAA